MNQPLDAILSLLEGNGTRTMAEIGVLPFLVLLAAALVGSVIVARLYVQVFGDTTTGTGLHRAFPMLGVSLAALFIVIQFSLPLGLGLLAALTLARFRTPVKEPEEIGFVMLVVAVATSTAVFRLTFAGLLLIAAAGALLVRWPPRRDGLEGQVVVAMPDPAATGQGSEIVEVVGSKLPQGRLTQWSQLDGRTVLTWSFQDTAPQAVRSVESAVRDAAPQSSVSVFLSRHGLQ